MMFIDFGANDLNVNISGVEFESVNAIIVDQTTRQRWTTLPGIFQVFSRYCAVGSRYWHFLPGILAFLENCAIPGKYLENVVKSGIPGKKSPKFAGIFQVFSRYCAFAVQFPGICFFFPGIAHFFF